MYVLLCTGLAALLALGIAPLAAFLALMVLLLPSSAVVFAVVANVALLADGFPTGPAWQVALVVSVALLARLQVWWLRAAGRRGRDAYVRAPVASGTARGV